jgi:hypothetical protein
MSAHLIIITGAIYAYVAFDQWRIGNYGMAWAYSGYAWSNVGLWMLAK